MRFRLATVLRARQAQEDMARGVTARARAEADAAAGLVRRAERRLDDQDLPGTGVASAYAAAIWARQALAGALGDAITAAHHADAVTQARVAELAAAAVRRKALERLAERHAAELRRAEEAADRAVLDELASTRFHRKQKK